MRTLEYLLASVDMLGSVGKYGHVGQGWKARNGQFANLRGETGNSDRFPHKPRFYRNSAVKEESDRE